MTPRNLISSLLPLFFLRRISVGLKDSIFPGRPVWRPPCPTWQPAPRPVYLLWRLLRAQTHLPSPSLSKAMQIEIASECSVCICLWWVCLL